MIAEATLIVDLMLGALACALGLLSVGLSNLKQAIAMFIALGLILALIWLRLAAPDLALAEAALGSGVLGGLLIMASRGIKKPAPDHGSHLKNIAATSLSLLLAMVMGYASLELLSTDNRQLAEVLTFEYLADSGVTNPVTAVLLNYRAYDTLLELTVVLAACISVFIAGPQFLLTDKTAPFPQRLIKALLPVIALFACYLLWIGAKEPGGAFQAGSLLAGGVALFMLIGLRYPLSVRSLRWSLGLGVLAFLVVGLSSLLSGQPFFTLESETAGLVILLIEIAATISVTAALAALFLGGHPQRWYAHASKKEESS